MLQQFGLDSAKTFHNTGLYVDIEGTASGLKRLIALRGDIDVLPIHEAREDLPYRSQVSGVMHGIVGKGPLTPLGNCLVIRAVLRG